MTTFELHPLCSLFPRVTGAEFDALAADIKANGLRQPIVLHEGMVLDGGNRYRACIEAGVEPRFVEFAGDSIVAFVLSANLHRRHLTPGQQAAIVASAQDWAQAQTRGGDRKSDQSATLHFDSAAARAVESGASLRTQKMVDAVAKADPELAKQVAHGELTLPKALAKVKGEGKKNKKNKKATKAKAPTKQAAQSDEDAYEAGDDDTAADLLTDMQADVERLTALVKAAEADDLKAETIKWRRMYDDAVRKQSDAMDAVKRAEKREAWNKKQLMRCGRAVGETDPDKIPAAVEAMARTLTPAIALRGHGHLAQLTQNCPAFTRLPDGQEGGA